MSYLVRPYRILLERQGHYREVLRPRSLKLSSQTPAIPHARTDISNIWFRSLKCRKVIVYEPQSQRVLNWTKANARTAK